MTFHSGSEMLFHSLSKFSILNFLIFSSRNSTGLFYMSSVSLIVFMFFFKLCSASSHHSHSLLSFVFYKLKTPSQRSEVLLWIGPSLWSCPSNFCYISLPELCCSSSAQQGGHLLPDFLPLFSLKKTLRSDHQGPRWVHGLCSPLTVTVLHWLMSDMWEAVFCIVYPVLQLFMASGQFSTNNP